MSLEQRPFGHRLLLAVVIVLAVLLALLILGKILGGDEARGQGHVMENPFTTCQLVQKGIRDKEAVTAALQIMMVLHMMRTADNIVAFPTMEDQQIAAFEVGLRRAIALDAKLRAVIERVYGEQKK